VTADARAPARLTARFGAGPLDVTVTADDAELAALGAEYFGLYGPQWHSRTRPVFVALQRGSTQPSVRGSMLRCARMCVDRTSGGYVADGLSGLHACGESREHADWWTISVPPGAAFEELQIVELQDLLGLACTVGWRAAGWIAVHAAVVAKGGCAALLCAPSGGGKSTLTTALVQNGWETLGDDKVLLRRSSEPVAASLLRTFNLDPRTGAWFDALGTLGDLPRYSQWTQKRRVRIEALRDGALRARAVPTHVVQLVRRADTPARAQPMPREEVLATLLRQVVIPRDREIARMVVSALAGASRGWRGFVFEVGENAYAECAWLRAFEDACCKGQERA
jgi:hypothetical protein